MKAIDKIKDMLDDLQYNMPDWLLFVIKVSAISIIWAIII
tara:strand:- start:879 stop:998 length:120 start_codon:yes stop_codon:yes gene_type:complete